MTTQEPFKPISIDKKLGEVYFDEKCLLSWCGPAPKTNSFSTEQAEDIANKHKSDKKPVKIKIMALADSMILSKVSKIGKKPPLTKIKYSDVKIHKIFPQFKKALVLGVHVSGGSQQYLILTFEQPLKATQLDDELTYADDAPKHNLKNRIAAQEPVPMRDHSPYYVTPENPLRELSSTSVRSQSEVTNKSREITPIHENGLPTSQLDPSTELTETVSTSGFAGLPKQPTGSVIHALSPSSLPKTTQSNAAELQNSKSNHSQTANTRSPSTPTCAKCRWKSESMVSTATSPVNDPDNKFWLRSSSTSRSRDDSLSLSRTQSLSLSQSRSHSHSLAPTREEYLQHGRSDSLTNTSCCNMTTDASSHYVVYEERPLYGQFQQQQEAQPSPINRETIVVMDMNSRQKNRSQSRKNSASSSSFLASTPVTYRTRKSRHGKQRRSITSSSRIHHNHSEKRYESISPAEDSSRPLFILATGRFKPFSELSHEHDSKMKGICTICGEVGSGGPRTVEVIRTDYNRGPVISDDGTVYMYSTTRPVEHGSGDRFQRKGMSCCGRLKHQSSNSSDTDSNLERAAMILTPDRNPWYSGPSLQNEKHHSYPKGSRSHKKKIYRLESSDSNSSSSSSDENETRSRLGIRVMPLRY